MKSNFVSETKLTHKKKTDMYMKCTKKELVEMIIECNRILKGKSIEIPTNNRVKTYPSTTTMNASILFMDKDEKKEFKTDCCKSGVFQQNKNGSDEFTYYKYWCQKCFRFTLIFKTTMRKCSIQ